MWLTILFLTTACTSAADDQNPGDTDAESTVSVETTPTASEADADADVDSRDEGPNAAVVALPLRDGPRRETTGDVPHIQIDAVLTPEVDAELQRRAFSLPGLETRESTVSLPGALSLWLGEDVELARGDVLLSGREFGHIHPDGSLHLLLPVERAQEVADAKWGELHPWAERPDFWDGLVMVFTPETLDEVDVTMQLIVDAYNFVTGRDLDPADFA